MVVVVVDVVVVDEVVVVEALLTAEPEFWGSVVVVVVVAAAWTTGSVVVVAAPVGEATAWDAVASVVVVTADAARTVTDCDAAPEAYTSLPLWLAEMRQVPAVLKVTTPAEIEHTDWESLAITSVGARNAELSTLGV